MKEIHRDDLVWVPNGDGSESQFIDGREAFRQWSDGRWRRDDDPYAKRLMTNGTDGPESIQDDELFCELRQIIRRELMFTREEHLVRLTVEIELSS